MIKEFQPMHVRPMTEQPTVPFRYVSSHGEITELFRGPHTFDGCAHDKVGWIPARFTPKPPEPKDGEWWKCRYTNDEVDTIAVLFHRDSHWYLTPTVKTSWFSEFITPLYKMVPEREGWE